MKITIEETVKREIELHSRYFRDSSWYYMIIDNETMMTVKDFGRKDTDSALWLFPEIRIERLSPASLKHASPISEAEFKAAFLRVSVRIEETLNN